MKQWLVLVEFYEVFYYQSFLQPQEDSRLSNASSSNTILMNVLNNYTSVHAVIC